MIAWWLRSSRVVRWILTAVLTIVGIFALAVVMSAYDEWQEAQKPALPFSNALTNTSSTLRVWDDDVGRARFVAGGYELLVKQSGRTVSGIVDTQRAWHQRVEVTVELRRASGQPDSSTPSVGVICRSTQDAFYDLRLGIDGSYAIYHRERGDDYRMLGHIASDHRTGAGSTDSIRVAAECVGWNPTVVRMFINGQLVLMAEDRDPILGSGHGGFLIGSSRDLNFAVLFTDFVIRDLGSP